MPVGFGDNPARMGGKPDLDVVRFVTSVNTPGVPQIVLQIEIFWCGGSSASPAWTADPNTMTGADRLTGEAEDSLEVVLQRTTQVLGDGTVAPVEASARFCSACPLAGESGAGLCRRPCFY